MCSLEMLGTLFRTILFVGLCAHAGLSCSTPAWTASKPSIVTPSAVVKKAPVRKRAIRLARRWPKSVATQAGLREVFDPLALSSSVAYMVDEDNHEVFFEKNAQVQLPIASVTKLMTALVIVESGLDMHERLRMERSDHVKSRAMSKLCAGMSLTREDALKAALISSDNRAAHLLARTWPQGLEDFVERMNERAQSLGMWDTVFVDPTGISNGNLSTARDLARLVARAHCYPIISEITVSTRERISVGLRRVLLTTTNRLLSIPSWNVGLQKTGFTRAAGRCMVVQTEFSGRRFIMVVLDALSNRRRADDMIRMRRWVQEKIGIPRSFAQIGESGLL